MRISRLVRSRRPVGITSAEQLRKVGAKESWFRILAVDSSACYLRLKVLEGAVSDIPKKILSDAKKAGLKKFYTEAKKK